MGQPPSCPSLSSSSAFSPLSSQHERLILELLPFKDARVFQEWLRGPQVQGSWREFCADFLSENPLALEVDKTKTSQTARDAINSKTPKYLVYHPEKDGWSQDDHVVRFIVTVVADNMLRNLWSESEWKKRGLDITKAVYEVLSFLRASSSLAAIEQAQNPPRYSD